VSRPETWVDCPAGCDAEIDAQRIIGDRRERTECCGRTRDELFELVDPDEPEQEPMEDAYPIEVDA
jgi:hypothetical protein